MSNILYTANAMSFEEKLTWILLILGPGIYAAYLATVLPRLDGTPIPDVAYEVPLATAIGVAIGASIAAHIVTAILSPDDAEQRDERDVSIDRRGYHVAFYVLAAGAVFAMSLAMLRKEHFWIANTIYLTFVLMDVTAQTVKVVGYRRGF